MVVLVVVVVCAGDAVAVVDSSEDGDTGAPLVGELVNGSFCWGGAVDELVAISTEGGLSVVVVVLVVAPSGCGGWDAAVSAADGVGFILTN